PLSQRVGKYLADEVDLGLDHRRVAREGRLGSEDREEVRESWCGETEQHLRAFGPLLGDRAATYSVNVHFGEWAGDRVESRCENDHVEVVLGGAGAQSSGSDLTDRILTDADQAHV